MIITKILCFIFFLLCLIYSILFRLLFQIIPSSSSLKRNSKSKELRETRELLEKAFQSQQDEFKTFVEMERERMKQEQAFELEKIKMEFQNKQSMLQIMMQSQLPKFWSNPHPPHTQRQQGGYMYTQQQQNLYPERDEPSTSSDSTWESNFADKTYWDLN